MNQMQMVFPRRQPDKGMFASVVIVAMFWLASTMANAQDHLSRNFSMFPNATIAPPIPATASDGTIFIPGWTKADQKDAFYQPTDGSHAGFLQIIRINDGFNIDSFFDLLISEAGLTNVNRPKGVQAEAFSATFGPMVAAVFGKADHQGQPIQFFADLHGPDDENKVIGTLIYAQPDVFNSWDGVLLPLLRNGYVKDPSIFDNREVLRAGNDTEKTNFYVGMVNTKIMAEFGALSILSEGAMQAARNASTIAGCAGASNCSVSYDGMGNAVADFDLN